MNDSEFAAIAVGKLLNIGGMLRRGANHLFQPFGLNQQQYSILFEISRAGRVSQKDIINRMLLEKPHVSKVVKKLSAMGLVKVDISPEDKRSTLVSITDEGLTVAEECRGVIQEWNSSWVESVEPGQRQVILDNLGLLQAVFRDNIPGK